ncbi:MAG: sulfatase [Chlamydiae bacterium]|nr:MAG: sulfatase [Chlamydiota bacterium]
MKNLSRRDFMKNVALAAMASTVGASLSSCANAVKKINVEEKTKMPNLIYVFPDQFRRQSLGFLNEDPVITPNLNKFASESLVLTDCVSCYPLCSPYRAMLLTGKYPAQNKVLTNCHSRRYKFHNELQKSDRCISDVLHDNDYSLGYIGKWHLESPLPEKNTYGEYTWTPPDRRHGFDYWCSYGSTGHHFHTHYYINSKSEKDVTEISEWSPKFETDVATNYIKNTNGKYRKPNQPFALFLAYNPPHPNYKEVPEKYVKMYDGKNYKDLLVRPNLDPKGETSEKAKGWVKNYFAAVTGIDDQFGRILNCLKEQGLDKNTIVIFTSDHGDMMGSHNLRSKNVWYEESMGVPFIIRWPGHIKPGKDDLLINTPDIMPTLLAMMGLKNKIPKDVQGKDLAGAFLGKKINRPDSSFYFLIKEGKPDSGRRGLRTHRYTFVISKSKKKNKIFLYDNKKDPYQLENIADSKPELVKKLTEKLYKKLTEINDPWVKNS